MTPRQEKFIAAYLSNGFNATEAAISAGYSKKSAYSHGARLLRNDKIKARLDKKLQNVSDKSEVKAVQVINELAKIAFSNIKNVASWTGEHVQFIDSDDIPDEIACCIQEINQHESQTQFGGSSSFKLKLYDKVKALDLIGKYLGLWIEKHEHTGADGKPLQVQPIDPRMIINEAAKLLKQAESEDVEPFE